MSTQDKLSVVNLAAEKQLINIVGHTPDALRALVASWGEKPFRADQLLRWVHQRGVADFTEMSDLAKIFRTNLAEHASVAAMPITKTFQSADGTRKWLFDVGQGNAIETVYIPEDDRGTLCISSQAGCAVNCRFCSTGAQGFSRNLTAAEITGQLWFAEHTLRQLNIKNDGEAVVKTAGQNTQSERVISNVVFMGMGEPLLNYEPVLASLKLMLSDNAYGLSRRRVTVSTSGVVPAMDKLREDCPVALAVSLHAPNDALRDELVPLNKKYPLKELMAACARYVTAAPRDFITFEYCMLDGVNDTERHALELVALVRDVPCKFNLIPFNPFPASGLLRSKRERVVAFANLLTEAGIVTTIRKTRGSDIDAACGQLAGEVQDRTQRAARAKVQNDLMNQQISHVLSSPSSAGLSSIPIRQV